MQAMLFVLTVAFTAAAVVTEYTLTIDEKSIAPSGRTRTALAINGTIPGPVLEFTQEDTARITVYNQLKREHTSVHWHGLLLPWAQDGVPYLTTPTIPPGASHTFEFQLRHAGTYWYHSHTNLQEQSGIYGAIVIHPKNKEQLPFDKDYVVQLSDWTNENPSEVMRTLMRGSHYYAIRKQNMQSITGAIKARSFKDYMDQAKARMPAMDISDVAYDQFWVNGKPQITLAANQGERIRLRFINSGASTYFYLTWAAGPFTIIAADGINVQPVSVNRILIGVAETYDVILTMPKESGIYEIRATAQDGSGYATVLLGSGSKIHYATNPPEANIFTMEETMRAGLASTRLTYDSLSPRPQPPYQLLRALTPTAFDTTNHPLRKIELKLTGNMTRYVWSINNQPLSPKNIIKVKKGEILKISIVNNTMMHHPMHLHGHFFRVITSDYQYSPLKHTVDVPPMGRRVIEFEANEVGDWFFHCHLLYHMHAGMARVFSYEELGQDHTPRLGPKTKIDPVVTLDGSVQSNMSEAMVMVMWRYTDIYFMGDISYHNWHEFHRIPSKQSGEFGLNYFVNHHLSINSGYQIKDNKSGENFYFAGVKYLLPYMINSSIHLLSSQAIRTSVDKKFQLTPRISQFNKLTYTAGLKKSFLEYETGLEFLLSKQFSIIAQFSEQHGLGAGITFRL